VIAERHGTTVDAAFEMIRRHARDQQLGITIVAERIVNHGLDPTGDQA
jgi:AmiR/NasT family two-component response regulator